MEPHPLRGFHRWLVLPTACAASATVASLMRCAVLRDVVKIGDVAFIAALSAAAGLSTAASGKLWLSVILSPAFGLAAILPFVVEIVWSQEWNQARGEVALMMFQFLVPILVPLTAPLTALQSWRLRRGHAGMGLFILAAGAGLAAEPVINRGVKGENWIPSLHGAVFCVAYYVGGLLAVEATIRIAARKANASPR